ncbi:MAG TPA: hypothetical protein VGK20_18210 [Candidatus Binatia bacterium]|jgi:hypothetical protein
MFGSRLTLLVAAGSIACVAGCAMPEVLPLNGGVTQGPSPYGPWYEQNWSTNAMLLAASDQPTAGSAPSDAELNAATGGTAATVAAPSDTNAATGAPIEVNAAPHGTDFDTSSPYQFPSSAYQAPAAPAAPPPGNMAPPAPAAPAPVPAPDQTGPIRY